jgi:DNA-binding response OmpR family regulator
MVNKSKVLVCSNDLTLALKIKIFLELKGFHVLDLISSGDDLIKITLNQYPSLIISDITLKGDLDGIEAISRLSGITKIPYIFVANSNENISLVQSYYLNPVKILIKPVDLNELYSFVNDSTGFINETQHTEYYLG